MLNVKQESCIYQFLNLLVRLDKGIEPGSTDYEADALTTRTSLSTSLNLHRYRMIFVFRCFLQLHNNLKYLNCFISFNHLFRWLMFSGSILALAINMLHSV